jgi:predicted amidophosphoribosyltransferase
LLYGLCGFSGCAVCGRTGSSLCPRCRPPPTCAPAPGCPPATRVIAVWDYAGTARSLVLDLKLKGRKAAARPLVDGLCDAARRNGVSAEAVTGSREVAPG